MGTVWLNGSFIDAADAKVSVLDRGFLFADGVYEVIPCYGGKPFRLDAHLERLERSLAGVRLASAPSRAEWQSIIGGLLARQDARSGNVSVYLQVTRGAAAKRDHAFPKENVAPTVLAMATPMPVPPVDDGDAATGSRVITAGDIRWARADIKSISLLPNVLLRQMAVERGAQECVMVRDGFVTEGAASNVFLVQDGALRTPARSHEILNGITRNTVIELALADGIPVVECDIAEDELRRADELWLTSSIREVVPVTHIDDRPVGNGAVGPLWKRMARLFRAHKQAFVAGTTES